MPVYIDILVTADDGPSRTLSVPVGRCLDAIIEPVDSAKPDMKGIIIHFLGGESIITNDYTVKSFVQFMGDVVTTIARRNSLVQR